jgi:hypothetical protein
MARGSRSTYVFLDKYDNDEKISQYKIHKYSKTTLIAVGINSSYTTYSINHSAMSYLIKISISENVIIETARYR